jgi:hypothetical protein
MHFYFIKKATQDKLKREVLWHEQKNNAGIVDIMLKCRADNYPWGR